MHSQNQYIQGDSFHIISKRVIPIPAYIILGVTGIYSLHRIYTIQPRFVNLLYLSVCQGITKFSIGPENIYLNQTK